MYNSSFIFCFCCFSSAVLWMFTASLSLHADVLFHHYYYIFYFASYLLKFYSRSRFQSLGAFFLLLLLLIPSLLFFFFRMRFSSFLSLIHAFDSSAYIRLWLISWSTKKNKKKNIVRVILSKKRSKPTIRSCSVAAHRMNVSYFCAMMVKWIKQNKIECQHTGNLPSSSLESSSAA